MRKALVVFIWVVFILYCHSVRADEKPTGKQVSNLITRLKCEETRDRALAHLIEIGEPAVSSLIEVLKEKNQDVRKAAAVALMDIGEPAVEKLIEAFKSDKHEQLLRAEAAWILGNIRDERAFKPLVAALKDDKKKICRSAAFALSTLGDIKAVEPLIAMLTEEDRDVQRWAVIALGGLRDERAVEPLVKTLKENPVIGFEFAEALAKIGKPAFRHMTALLLHEDRHVRYYVATVLGRLGDAKAVEPLIAVLGDRGKDDVRAGAYGRRGLRDGRKRFGQPVATAAIMALGRIGDKRALEPLVKLLKDDDFKYRLRAVQALRLLGGKEAIKHLLDAMANDSVPMVRRDAALVLADLGEQKAVEPIIKMLKDESEYVRRDAIQALGKLSSRTAVGPLIEVLKNVKEEVYERGCAADALGRIGDKKAIEPLIDALKEHSHIRGEAVEALAAIGTEKAVIPLLGVLKDERWSTRVNAVRALGKLKDARAVKPLTKRLQDTDKYVRHAAATALGNIGGEAAVQTIMKLFREDRDRTIRAGLACALVKTTHDEDAFKFLIQALKSRERWVRACAVASLGTIGDNRAVEPLIPILKDRRIHRDVARVLGNIGDKKAVPALIEMFRNRSYSNSRCAAAEALAMIGDKRAIEPLIKALEYGSRDFRYSVAQDIKEMTGQDFGLDYAKWKTWYEKNKDK